MTIRQQSSPTFPSPLGRYEQNNEAQFRAAVARAVQDALAAAYDWDAPVYTDATRPAAGRAGRVIYNTTDGQLNVDTGAAWTLPDGTVT